MKVLIVSLLGRGGMIHYTSQLANAVGKNNDVMVMLPTHAEDKYFEPYIRLSKINAPPSALKSILLSMNIFHLKNILGQINKFDPDVIHIVNTHPWNNIIVWCFKDYPIVYTLHDPIPHEVCAKKRLFQILVSWNDWYGAIRSTRLIVHGKLLKQHCEEKGIPQDKIAVIPHGDYSFFAKEMATQAFPWVRNLSGKTVILFFGRIEPYKGLEYLLQSYISAQKKIQGLHLIVAGEGDLSPYQDYIRNIRDVTIINTYISDEEVTELFTISDVIVLPYISATQSGIIPIAYAFKKPVIASNVGAISEVVDDGITGILVPPKNVEALSKAIALLNDPVLRRSMGNSAFRKMREEMSWDAISERTISIYRSAYVSKSSEINRESVTLANKWV